jgi:AcrR family transcriptional regulator
MSVAEAHSRRERPGKAAILRAAVEVMGEDGYEGASVRDMAARAGVSVAALYYHFPSKHDLLREFLDEAWEITLARIDRRLEGVSDRPADRLDEIVATLIASLLHDDFAQLAAKVAFREYTRLNPPERALVEQQQTRLLDLVESVIVAGVDAGDFSTAEPRETARAIITLSASLVEPYPEMGRTLPEVIELYQGFARGIARS